MWVGQNMINPETYKSYDHMQKNQVHIPNIPWDIETYQFWGNKSILPSLKPIWNFPQTHIELF